MFPFLWERLPLQKSRGLIDKEIRDIIEEKAKYVVLNCQTNSSNKGLNIITKYRRADIFSLDQYSSRLSFLVRYLCFTINGI